MSLRPITRSALRHTPLVSTARGISSSSVRRAGHQEDHGDSSADTHETFFSPAMRTTLILTALLTLSYPYLPSAPKSSASPSTSPESFASQAQSSDVPYITRMLARFTPSAQTWTDRNDKHLEMTKSAAEERLLFQEAERPKVWRMRYAAAFEQASPNRIPVGSQTDLTDLQVKRD